MATRLHGILVDGLNKPLVNTTVTLLSRGNTLITLNGSEAVFRTDSTGAYNITVNSGHYNVIVGPQGLEPYKAGEIIIYADSPEGSLNGYLVDWAPEELTPDIIKQVQDLVSASENHALQAGRSAAAANADATDARNSKTSAASSAADALVSKNDATASADAAKQAQASAAGSANTANAAVTTIQGLKSDVETLKTQTNQIKLDTQGIKDSAITDIGTAKTEAVNAVNTTKDSAVHSVNTAKDQAVAAIIPLKDAAAASATASANSATQAQTQAGNAAASATAAKTSEINSGTNATRAETAASNAEATLSNSLLKANNLSDLADNAAARRQMGVDRLINANDIETQISSGARNKYLYVRSDGYWGAYDNTTPPGINLALSVAAGGTGAVNDKQARLNLKVPVESINIPDGTNILGFFITQGEGGIYNSGSSIVNPPPVTDWWDFHFTVHGRGTNDSPVYGTVTAIGGQTNRMFVITLQNGAWPGGWFEIYRQKSPYVVFDHRITSYGYTSVDAGFTANQLLADGSKIIATAEMYTEMESSGVARTVITSGSNDNNAWSYLAYNSKGSLYRTNSDWGIDKAYLYLKSSQSNRSFQIANNMGDYTYWPYIQCFIRDSVTQVNCFQINAGDSDWLFYTQRNGDGSKVLEVNGSVRGTIFQQTSDRDLKDNITEIDNATEKLRKIHGYTYILKENGMPFAGLIAQEVGEVIPEALGSFVDYKALEGPTQDGQPLYSQERFYSLDYNAVTALLTQVCKESDERITKLENEISELKALVTKLTGSIESTTDTTATQQNPTNLP